HECVERRDLRSPGLRVRLLVLMHDRRNRLVEEWEIEGCDVDHLERRITTFGSDVENPACYVLAFATRSRAPDNDCHFQHVRSPYWFERVGPAISPSVPSASTPSFLSSWMMVTRSEGVSADAARSMSCWCSAKTSVMS